MKLHNRRSDILQATTRIMSSAPNKGNNSSVAASNASSPAFRLMLLVAMVVQNSAVVLVGRYTRSTGAASNMFIVSHFIFVTEVAKLIGSCALEQFTTGRLFRSIKLNIIDTPIDTLKTLIPALLYLLQNSLLYIALSNLSAPLFQVTYQSKLLTTALVSVVMLDRRYTFVQWICLTALGFGVAIVVLGENSKSSSTASGDEQNMTKGLLAVLVACFSSAFAGVYFEVVLKKPSGGAIVSLWMRNFQLAFFSAAIAAGQILYENHKMEAAEVKPILYGFDFWVWVLVALQAGGGLLIAAIIKYADNVLKGLATGVAVAVSTFCSMIIFGTPLTMQFAFGATIILMSVYWFSNSGAAAPKKTEPSGLSSEDKDDSDGLQLSEMKPILASV